MSPRLPHGAWPSPISAARVAGGALRLSDPQIDGGAVYWVEGRPAEQGRCVVVRHREGRTTDLLPSPFSARNTVHEYGGGALRVADGTVFFTNMSDQLVYRIDADGTPRALTPPSGDVRYADLELDASRDRLIAVMEDHGDSIVNDIRCLPLEEGSSYSMVSGNDFYAYPRVSPDGTRLAWITWNQPEMPWDGTELWVGDLDAEGNLSGARLVAGGRNEAIFQPAWSPEGALHFCSDRTGWWNLYRVEAGGEPTPLAPLEEDCGHPLWVFNLSTYAFCGGDRIALIAARDGIWRLHLVDRARGGLLATLDLPFTAMRQLSGDGDLVAMTAGGPRQATAVVTVDVRSGAHQILRATTEHNVEERVLSIPVAISFEGSGGARAHAFYYAPRNDDVEASPDERPPLVVHAHGGPTSATDMVLSDSVLYWTSRGFGYVDVNYGGSSGYGREYRRRLNGQEGVVDVEDCIGAARHLAAQGQVDGSRMTITGGSAGGYIVLCAMTYHDVFAAGSDHYGIADWETLIGETHKFEARYFDYMIGPYPERRDLYYDRSPIHFIERVRRPVIIFQGLEDRIVPPDQSQVMYDALRERGIPCAYLAFEGEQHGFRKESTIERTLEAELAFYCRVLRIEPEEGLATVDIANEDRL